MIRFLQTPGKTKKIVLGGILVLIIIGMTVYLIPGIGSGGDFGSGSANVLAKVGDQEITITRCRTPLARWANSSFRAASRRSSCRS